MGMAQPPGVMVGIKGTVISAQYLLELMLLLLFFPISMGILSEAPFQLSDRPGCCLHLPPSARVEGSCSPTYPVLCLGPGWRTGLALPSTRWALPRSCSSLAALLSDTLLRGPKLHSPEKGHFHQEEKSGSDVAPEAYMAPQEDPEDPGCFPESLKGEEGSRKGRGRKWSPKHLLPFKGGSPSGPRGQGSPHSSCFPATLAPGPSTQRSPPLS